MKRLSLTILAACVLVLAGCPSNPPKTAPVVDSSGGTPTNNGSAKTDAIPQVTAPTADEELMQGELAKRSIYFDLDSYVIKDEFRHTVEAHAAFLKRNPGRKVVLEGNADERGSSEYNLALGQKRSEAVKSMMRVLGVPEAQLEAVSFGKERPKNPGHDEAAWAENRRVDISYRPQ
jgi:peptidoglycan-associated lipoprotein